MALAIFERTHSFSERPIVAARAGICAVMVSGAAELHQVKTR
jgi:hypothetical protein